MKKGSRRLLFGIGGILCAGIVFIMTVNALIQGDSIDPQFAATGSFKVHADDAAKYYLWDNYLTVFRGSKVSHSNGFPAGISFVIRDSHGREMNFTKDDQHGWRVGNHGKKSIGYIETAEAVDVTVQVQGGDGKRVLSFSKADELGDVWRHLRGFAIGGCLLVLGLLVAVWGFIVRVGQSNNPSS